MLAAGNQPTTLRHRRPSPAPSSTKRGVCGKAEFFYYVVQCLADPTNVPHEGIDRAKIAPSAFGAGIT